MRKWVGSWLAAICLVGTMSAVSSCEGVNGDSSAARGEVRYSSADGTFGITFVSPPWEVAREDNQELELQVATELLGVSIDGAPPTHALLIGHVDVPEGIDELIDEELIEAGAIDTEGIETLGFETQGFETQGFETQGFDPNDFDTDLPEIPEGVELPSYLTDIDLADPGDVAFAELNFLLDTQDAELDSETQLFTTVSGNEGLVYQAIVDPGVFVRVFYFRSSGTVVRAAFASLFNLESADIELMAETIVTDAVGAIGPDTGTGTGTTSGGATP